MVWFGAYRKWEITTGTGKVKSRFPACLFDRQPLDKTSKKQDKIRGTVNAYSGIYRQADRGEAVWQIPHPQPD
jgi:hypothetical protein